MSGCFVLKRGAGDLARDAARFFGVEVDNAEATKNFNIALFDEDGKTMNIIHSALN